MYDDSVLLIRTPEAQLECRRDLRSRGYLTAVRVDTLPPGAGLSSLENV